MKLENIIIFQKTVNLIKEAQASEHQMSICVFGKSKISTRVWIFYPLGTRYCRRELSNFSPAKIQHPKDCDPERETFQDLNHGIKNVFSGQVLGWMRTPREILHLVLMCRQPESRMEFVNSRWCGNLFGIELPSKS